MEVGWVVFLRRTASMCSMFDRLLFKRVLLRPVLLEHVVSAHELLQHVTFERAA